MRIATLLTLLSALASPSLALADAIAPFDGECPPGLDRGEQGHAEACIPRACSTDADCGSGAACREIRECWAPRPDWGDGRLPVDEPTMRDMVIGLCAADGTCAEGHCDARRQCEPTAHTDAWDAERRAWTQVPYSRPLFGCSASGAAGSSIVLLVVGAAIVSIRQRRR